MIEVGRLLMKIIVAGYFPFPSGSASAARVRNLAMGLRDCGAQVHVISTAPAVELPDGVSDGRIVALDGLTYEYVAPRQSRQISRGSYQYHVRNRSWGKLSGLIRTYSAGLRGAQRLRKRLSESSVDAVYIYGNGALRIAPLALSARQQTGVSVLDVVEHYDSAELFGSHWNPIYWDVRIGNRILPRLFDGFSVITTDLERLYAASRRPVLIVPSVEDWQDLPPVSPNQASGTFRLLYVGALIVRDAPEQLLEAMRILARRKAPVTLDIVGRFEEFATGRRYAQLCREDPLLRSCVNLVGAVSDLEVTRRLQSADGLILLRRDALSELYSFPTRLVEYLRYGHPTFVTAVGDISHYLRPNMDAVLLKSGDPDQIADAIAGVVARDDRGMAIGQQGRLRGAECFDRQQHAARLIDFFRSIQCEKLKHSLHVAR